MMSLMADSELPVKVSTSTAKPFGHNVAANFCKHACSLSRVVISIFT